MSKELVCPFCNKKLEPIGTSGQFQCGTWGCDASFNFIATRDVWEYIARTRKENDIRKKQTEIANKAFDFICKEWDNIDCSRKELGACAFNAKEDIAGWESDIEQTEHKGGDNE
jgi:hypothetical protein